MATTTLNVSQLDFFTIKQTLKDFFKNQPEFTDYNFDGAGLNVLFDALAYSTHMTGVYTNLGFADTFLDSAVQRASVTSRAKELGYIPRSKTAAVATIRISFSVPSNPAQYIIPKGTRFSASGDSETYTFVTIEDHIIENVGNVFSDELTVYQGKFATISYVVDLNNAAQRFVLGSTDADTRFLSILQKDTQQSSTFNQFSFIDDVDIGTLAAGSAVYFLRETFDEFYEVYFGDGVIGKAMVNGNYIELTYLITDGPLANGSAAFTLASTLPNVTGASITTIEAAQGGSERETIESIKYLAPFYYQSQGRAVTTDDYKALIMSNYPNVDDLAIWGGEDNDPPFYGKVFIAIKPKTSSFFSNATKQTIQNNIVSRFNVMSIRPEIVDPAYIEVEVNTTVRYNARLYDGTTNAGLSQDIETAIEGFFANQANKFGQPLYYSKLVAVIGDVSPLILNSVTNLTLSRSIEIFSGLSATYKYTFNNALYPGSIRSNQFNINNAPWAIKDIPTTGTSVGVLKLWKLSEGGAVILGSDVGIVDYNSGIVTVQNVNIQSIVDDPIDKLLTISVSGGAFIDVNNTNVVYTDYNVYTNERDQIITLKDGGISITMIPDESV